MNSLPVATVLASIFILSSPASGASLDELIKLGDAKAHQYQEEEALDHYLAAAKLDPTNAYLHVAISREYRHLMSDARADSEKLRLGKAALSYAERAAALAPSDSHAQLAPAITYGKMLTLLTSNKDQLEASKMIKVAADKAVALDPHNDLAWHILGRWHRGIAEVGGVKRMVGSLVYGKMPDSSYENAAACFQRALALKPDRLMHYIELGHTYSKLGNPTEAARLIAQGLAMPETEKDDPATKQRGRQVLKDLR
ncbi:hypothetical protein BH23VER1_BH23VER1_15040 [soil metagenome]